MADQSEAMQIEENNQVIQQEDNYEENYQYQDYYYDVDNLSLKASLSQDRPYSIYNLDQLLKKIWEQIQTKSILCAMSGGWTLMLYYFANFNSNYFDDLLDQEQTGRTLIKYTDSYQVDAVIGECAVCLSETELYNNSCGHRFCIDCWKYHVSINHTDRNIFELFPLCQEDGCYVRTNYHLMQNIWKNEISFKENFDRLLCLKYSQQSIRVKICPNQLCGKAIYMNSVIDSTVTCQCGKQVCRHCGNFVHWPLQCFDQKNWNSIINDKDNQWINKIVTQKCPMCKETIEKNDGCIHMTCFCKYQFCWICLKVWKGHTGGFYACADVSRDEHQKKLKQEQQKRRLDENYYNQRFEEAKSEAQRLERVLKRIDNLNLEDLIKKLQGVQVLLIHTDALKEMKEFVRKAYDLINRCVIYCFFEREEFKDLKRIIFRLSIFASHTDDLMTDDLLKDFKQKEENMKKKEGSDKEIKQSIKNFFLKERQIFYAKRGEALHIIDLIRNMKIKQALDELISPKSLLFIEKEPLILTKINEVVPSSQQFEQQSNEVS